MENKMKKAVLVLCTAMLIALPLNVFAAVNNGTNCSSANGIKNVTCDKNYTAVNNFVNNGCDKANVWLEGFVKVNCDKNLVPPKNPGNVNEDNKPVPPKNPGNADGDKNPSKPSVNIGNYEAKVVDLVNKERRAAGLAPLKANQKLSEVAKKKAEDMRDNKYFDHNSPTYGSPFEMMKQFGVKYNIAGENIAMGQKTPESVMNVWMNSAGHKANIMKNGYTEIGVGYVTDSKGTTYWVQMFINPAK